MIDKDTVQLYESIIALHEGSMTEVQFAALNEKLKKKDNARYYAEFVSIFSEFSCPSIVDYYFERDNNDLLSENMGRDAYTDIMKKFAEEENTAPAIEISQEEPKQEIIQKVNRAKITYKLDKKSLLTILTSAAAVLLIVLFAKYAPVRTGKEVATLSGGLNTQWAGGAVPLEDGFRLKAGSESLQLLEGVANLVFDSGVNLVIEAPARFVISTEDQIELFYGRLYATVPSNAIGFQVDTTNSKIIDLGTEFGIYTPQDGEAELHVFKGKTSLISGTGMPGISRVSSEVLAGQAKRIHCKDSHVEAIPLKSDLFARAIDDQAGVVWRGEVFSLANVVAGGNGFAGGVVESGIDPSSGIIYPKPTEVNYNVVPTSYVAVKERPFIDGVFVPNGKSGANQISSAGHTFSGFPSTNGRFWSDITANPYVVEVQGKEKDSTPKKDPVIKTVSIFPGAENVNNPCILVHANAGITFDLRQIRQANPTLEMTAFTASCQLPSQWKTNAAFWVFLDGEPVFHSTANNVTFKPQQAVKIPIRPHHAFLTLATTDGQDGLDYDWCLFMQPEITFTPKIKSILEDEKGN